MLKRKKFRGQSTIEFIALMLFILGALLVFQKYIVRGISGRLKGVGDSLGEGRVYDPHKTVECRYDVFFEGAAGKWFNQACFAQQCEDHCLRVTKDQTKCDNCLSNTCHSLYCDD